MRSLYYIAYAVLLQMSNWRPEWKNKGNKHTDNQYGNPIYKSLYLHPISNLAYKYYLIPKPICARP